MTNQVGEIQVSPGVDHGADLTYIGYSDDVDQAWLDDRIADIDVGFQGVIAVATNWTEGRNLSRLHLGVSAAEYVLGHITHSLGRAVVMPLLEGSDWSNRQIAEIAGVSPDTVDRTARNQAVARPAKTLGADGRHRSRRVVPTTAEIGGHQSPELSVGTHPPSPSATAVRVTPMAVMQANAAYLATISKHLQGIVDIEPPLLADPKLHLHRRDLVGGLDVTLQKWSLPLRGVKARSRHPELEENDRATTVAASINAARRRKLRGG